MLFGLHWVHSMSSTVDRSTLIASITRQVKISQQLKEGVQDVFYSRTDLRMNLDWERSRSSQILLDLHSLRTVADNLDINVAMLCQAIRSIHDENLLQYILRDYSGTMDGLRADTGHHPIHIAIIANRSAVKTLLSAFPDAPHRPDPFSRLPLHLFLLHVATYDHTDQDMPDDDDQCEYHCVKVMIDSNCAAVTKPLEWSLTQMTEEFVGAPDGVRRFRRFHGLLPFHIACCRSASISVIFEILRAHPGALE